MMINKINSKIISWESLKKEIEVIKRNKKKIVFTNGCFDLIHRGHIKYLAEASDFGDVFIIGLNTDKSINRIKGNKRPIKDELTRALLLASFMFVDFVVLFDQDTPYELIKLIKPDILIKGSDYNVNEIVGGDIIIENGGQIKTIEFLKAYSSTKLINKIINTS
ncbi:MAG: D-glycero-beta-D-manno-heptose 1-phosphate adenylyltransferase [Bacteroidales bacterium]|nr:D-glycero-beta-D-manno-heptose 1-phosphate adenylyltransferase [Bacteroidales bacterium]